MRIPTYTLKDLGSALFQEAGYKFRIGKQYYETALAENEREACFDCAFRKNKLCLKCNCRFEFQTGISAQFYFRAIPKPKYEMPEEVRRRKREYDKAYAKAHPDKSLARGRTYRKKHPEKMRERAKNYREKNKEAVKARMHSYYEAHKEEYRARGRKWAKANPEKVREIQRKCYIRRKEKGAKNV